MNLRIQALLAGILSYAPGGYDLLVRRRKANRPNAGTVSARYCYSVWLRHLVLANKYEATNGVPETIAEVGPGDSLGTGLAGLLSGVTKYFAFDVVHGAKTKANIKVFEELVKLFMAKERIPDRNEFPEIITELDSYEFPSYILTDELLTKSLADSRLEMIRNELLNLGSNQQSTSKIRYAVPWTSAETIEKNSIDMIFSMSALEHIDDLNEVYRAAFHWLKVGGYMSHEIDFSSHNLARYWNGHWGYSDLLWRIMRGNKPYLINREPFSAHMRFLKQHEFNIITTLTKARTSGISRRRLAKKFSKFSDEDIAIYNAFVLAQKAKSKASG